MGASIQTVLVHGARLLGRRQRRKPAQRLHRPEEQRKPGPYYYSRRLSDDLIQRNYLAAFHEVLDPSHPHFNDASNPLSSVYGGRMVDPDRLYCYTWDAGPIRRSRSIPAPG